MFISILIVELQQWFQNEGLIKLIHLVRRFLITHLINVTKKIPDTEVNICR